MTDDNLEKNGEIIYNLEDSFEYAFQGESKTAGFISLSKPIMKQHFEAAQLQQSIMKMIRKEYSDGDGDDVKKEEAADLNGDAVTSEMILTLMFCTDSVNINTMFEQAKTLFKSGVALIDGEQKLTSSLIYKMSIDDFQNLTGEYIVNFILA